MLEKYLKEQPIVTKLLLNSINNNKLVQAYLFVSNDKSFLMQYSLDFSKKIICDDDKKISKMIDENTYPELVIIEPINNTIKKEQLISLQEAFSVKPTLGKKMVYIINGAEKLFTSSANTILKFLEEPSDDIVAILLTDNLQKVLPTIKSRCQILNFENKKDNEVDIIYKNYKNYYKSIEFNTDTYLEKVNNIINFIKKLDKNKLNTFIYFKQDIFDIYINKEDFMFLFDFILYFYYDILNLKLQRDLYYLEEYKNDLIEVGKNNSLDDIRNKIQIIEDVNNKLQTNMNLKLLIDDFIIKFSEV